MMVALDVGQTHVRSWVAGDPEGVRLEDGFAVNLGVRGAARRVAQRSVRTVRALVGATTRPVDVVCVGLSGFDTGSRGREATRVATAIADALPARRVVVAADDACWYLAALGARPGVLAAIGTGSVVLAADAAGAWARVDGYGYLLGDDGSGFAIGRAGLRSALMAADGRGGSGRLLDLAQRRFGEVGGIPARVFGARIPSAVVASFAEDVAAAAEAGDGEAGAIWDSAGSAVARSVAAAGRLLATTTGAVPVACVGAVFLGSDLLWSSFRDAVSAMPQAFAPTRSLAAWDGAVELLAEGMTATAMFPGLVVSSEAVR